MRRLLQGLLIGLGLGAIIIGSMIFLTGANLTARVAELIFNGLTGQPVSTGLSFTPTGDSELRFYAPFWTTYGGALIWAARDLTQRHAWVPPLAGLFFVGGIGRLLAFYASGPPTPVFVSLMGIELILPLVLVGLWAVVRKKA